MSRPFFCCAYDVAGNRLNRYDMVRTNASETYTYDRLDQLKTLWRGSHYESWNYDPTGNWISHVKHGTVQNRTHNAANEILNTVTHDDAGNMTEIPDLAALKYDAWNRLVGVGNNISYSYDGLNRRIKKVVSGTTTKSFFNVNWQEVEIRKGNTATTYVWGLRYVDDLVSREKDDVRLYALQDANWNVVALCDIDGAVLERYTYDGFGKRNVFDANGTSLSASVYGFDRAFTGQVLDEVTGLMCYRNRYYSTSLGRFLTRDPIGYDAADPNLYRYVDNEPLDAIDAFGLKGPTLIPVGIDAVRASLPRSRVKEDKEGRILLALYFNQLPNSKFFKSKTINIPIVFQNPTTKSAMESMKVRIKNHVRENGQGNYSGFFSNIIFDSVPDPTWLEYVLGTGDLHASVEAKEIGEEEYQLAIKWEYVDTIKGLDHQTMQSRGGFDKDLPFLTRIINFAETLPSRALEPINVTARANEYITICSE